MYTKPQLIRYGAFRELTMLMLDGECGGLFLSSLTCLPEDGRS